MNKTLGKTFIDNFQSQTQPQTQALAPTPLSTKTGINSQKKTALQQSILGAMSNPQGMMAQQNVQ